MTSSALPFLASSIALRVDMLGSYIQEPYMSVLDGAPGQRVGGGRSRVGAVSEPGLTATRAFRTSVSGQEETSDW